MEEPSKIMRRSIHTFLQHYHHFTAAAAVFAFPFSAAFLLSQPASFIHPSFFSSLHARLNTLFQTVSFPSSLDFFNILSLKLSQTISSSIFILPFSLTFLLFSKAYVISFLSHEKSTSLQPYFSSEIFSICYFPLLKTYLWNSFVLLSANASAFALFFFAFNLLEGFAASSSSFLLSLSASAAVIYSIILANALVICNLALVLAGVERSLGGYVAILKACVLIRGRASTALALALPVNLGLAGVEALFQYRIVKSYHAGDREIASLALEGMLIAYLYAIFIILDSLVNFLFYKSCKKEQEIDQEGRHSYKIEIFEKESGKCIGSKGFQEVP